VTRMHAEPEQLARAAQTGPWFHGGVPGLGVGNVLLSPADSRVNRELSLQVPVGRLSASTLHGLTPNQRFVYVTPCPAFAVVWARMWPGGGAVYQVEPLGRLRDDTQTAPEHPAASAQCAEAARVVSVVAPRVRSVWPEEVTDRMHEVSGFRGPVLVHSVVSAIWPKLKRRIMEHSPNGASPIHGAKHWLDVARIGCELVGRTPGADLDAVYLFALFHDSMRIGDGDDDPNHGARGAELAAKLRDGWDSVRRWDEGRGEWSDGIALPVTDAQFELAMTACRDHTAGNTTADPTIGCCWDADRLDLPRVGITPTAEYLSTEAARRRISA